MTKKELVEQLSDIAASDQIFIMPEALAFIDEDGNEGVQQAGIMAFCSKTQELQFLGECQVVSIHDNVMPAQTLN